MPHRIRAHLRLSPMLLPVTSLTEQLQVIEAQSDRRIIHCLRCEPYLVMHLYARNDVPTRQASLTQPTTHLDVRSPAFLPCVTAIQPLRELLMTHALSPPPAMENPASPAM